MLQPKVSQKKDHFLNNKNIRMFLVFLLMSFLFWLLINLSKVSTSVARFDLTYYNLPHSKVIQNAPLKYLKLELKAKGFKFLSYQLNREPLRINLDHIRHLKGGKYYYLPNNYLRELQAQLTADVELISVVNDTIFLDLTITATKKVKITPKLDITFKTGYNFAKPIKITPDSVEIQGPKAWLDTIKTVETEALNLENLSENINQELALKIIQDDKFKYENTQVHIKIEVEKFTETDLTTSFSVINLPNNFQISTIPQEVTIKYQVSLANFKKVTASMFIVQCDFALSEKEHLNYLIPQVVTQPDFVTMVQVLPGKIEYLLKK